MDSETQARLRPDEVVLYSGQQSLMRATLWALLGFFTAACAVFAIRFYTDPGDDPVSVMVFSAVLLGLAVGVAEFFIRYRRFELILTNQRLFHGHGLFRRRMEEFAVADIAWVDADRPGDFPFRLILTDGRSTWIRRLPRLDRLRDEIELARREISGQAQPNAAPA